METAKDILEQATTEDVTIEEGMHDKKNGETEAPGLKGGAMSADGVSPGNNKPTATTAKKPEMKKSDMTQGRGVRVRNGRRCRGRGIEDTQNQRFSPGEGMKEHLGQLFSGEELSEEFKDKEAAVTMRVDELRSNFTKSLMVNLKKPKQKWLTNLINTSLRC